MELFAKQLILLLKSTNRINVDKEKDMCQFTETDQTSDSFLNISTDTIQSVFMSRVDSLNLKQQLIVKLSSVIGFDVNISLLQHLLNLNDQPQQNFEKLFDEMENLCELEILDSSFAGKMKTTTFGIDDDLTVPFSHVLISETVYNSLTYTFRKF